MKCKNEGTLSRTKRAAILAYVAEEEEPLSAAFHKKSTFYFGQV